MKRFDFNKKIAVVTGASSGIGRAIATILVKKYDCLVYGIGRDLHKLDVVREELGPEKFLCCTMNVSDEHSWEKMAVYFKNSATPPDILINCAGVLPKFATVEKTGAKATEATLDTNFMSCVYSCDSLIPLMPNGGLVVNVSSAGALCPFAGIGAYSASKAALLRYTECAAIENRRIGISVAMPGFVKTDIMKNQSIGEKEKGIVNLFSSDPHKTAKKILRRAKKRKKKIVTGADAHFMSIMYRLFPRFAPKFLSFILRKSKMELFKEI